MTEEAPIVFIHYGPSGYLRHTLRAALRSNPAKRIYFLGDDSNRRFCPSGVEYLSLDLFTKTPKLEKLRSVFKALEGKQHLFNKHGGTKRWLAFVFERWFIIEQFLSVHGIRRFWVFDSDTIILAALASREERFSSYEATAQCRDHCLNGFIGSRLLVERYTKCIVELFLDGSYLAAQRRRVERQPGLAFNEMDAFCEFRRREKVQTFHAAQPLEGEFFDDALAYDSSFETSPVKIAGRIQVKRLWYSPDRALYARHLASGRYVRMITCNLSWLPDYIWRKLTPFCLTPGQDSRVTPVTKPELRELDLSPAFIDKIATKLQIKLFQFRRTIMARVRPNLH